MAHPTEPPRPAPLPCKKHFLAFTVSVQDHYIALDIKDAFFNPKVLIFFFFLQDNNVVLLIRSTCARRKLGFLATHWVHSKDWSWSDWADAQADLSLRWAHSHFVGFVMRWLKYGILPAAVCFWSSSNRSKGHHMVHVLLLDNMAPSVYNIQECSLCFYGNQCLSSF